MKFLINPEPRKHAPVKAATAGDPKDKMVPLNAPELDKMVTDADPGNDDENR